MNKLCSNQSIVLNDISVMKNCIETIKSQNIGGIEPQLMSQNVKVQGHSQRKSVITSTKDVESTREQHPSSDSGQFSCRKCNLVFQSLNLRNEHVDYFHAADIVCHRCKLIFKKESERMTHVESKHMIDKRDTHQCRLCAFFTTKPESLRLHMSNNHSRPQQYRCENCQCIFKNR